MQKNFLAFAQSETEFNFYARFKNGLRAKGFRLVLLTNRPSVLLQSKIQGIPCTLVKNIEPEAPDINVNSTVEVISKKMNEHDASQYYTGVMRALEHMHQTDGISVMFIWNGSSIPSKAMSIFARRHDTPTLFAEHTNLPKKLFIDPRGVFAQSLLFHKAELLDRYSVNDLQFQEWRTQYLSYKKSESKDIDDSHLYAKSGALSFVDVSASWFIDIPLVHNAKKERDPSLQISFDQYDISAGNYNFFPMQLSSESTLLFDNSVSLHDAIGIAYERSREQQRDLVIKPHPMERKKEIFDYLTSLHKEDGLYIVHEPSFQLVEHCKEIITVNSQLGLDGMLIGKKVTFLGATCFSHMDEVQLKKYVLCYLIDVDYFGKGEISVKTTETILSRLLLQ